MKNIADFLIDFLVEKLRDYGKFLTTRSLTPMTDNWTSPTVLNVFQVTSTNYNCFEVTFTVLCLKDYCQKNFEEIKGD